MLLKAGLLCLVLGVVQIPAEYVQPEFIENVIERESASAGSRIVSGWLALPGQHPHHAALRMVDPTGSVSACGGSIVHRSWVITAAHCTALRITLVVRAGVVSLTNPEYIFETTEWYNHPTYNDNLPQIVQPNDIGIVKLQRPVTYTRLLRAIRIQPTTDAFRNYAGELVHASGHGRTWTGGSTTEVLNWVYLRAVANTDCTRTFGSIITANTICAQFFNVTSQSPCQGDSGGPLVHVGSDGVPLLVGVTSFVAGGNFGCHSGLPAGFIRPGPFLSWFKDITGIDFENLNEDEAEKPTESPTERPTEPPTEIPTEPPTEPPTERPTERPTEPPTEEDESDEDDQVADLLKRLEVSVKVKVRFSKFKVQKEIETEKEM